MSTSRDDHLLARLNALKPSSVSLEDTAPSIDVGTSAPQSIEDKLAQRLKTLRADSNSARPKRFGTAELSPADELTAQVRGEVEADAPDPITGWQQQHGDEESLDDLLAELGTDNQWELDLEQPKHVEALLKEAQEALPPDSEPTAGHDKDGSLSSHHSQLTERCRHRNVNDAAKTEEQLDEEDAAAYVERVLAEIEIEDRSGRHSVHGKEQPATAQNCDEDAVRPLELPSTPSRLPDPTMFKEPGPPSYEDSELEARFTKLGLGGLDLPSTPQSQPSSRLKVTASLRPQTSPSKFTDEAIDSWCCICNEDGEVKCLGCDGDIYCQQCWREGHGTRPGQERGHKAVQYNRKGSAARA